MSQLLEFAQNHVLLFVALGVVLALLVANEVLGAVTGAKRISPQEAVRLINDRDALILDLRPLAEYKRGHLLGAVSLPFTKLGEGAPELAKDKQRPVLLYCALGGQAGQAAAALRKQGHAELYPLRGGINAWQAASLPVTTR